MNEPTTTPPRPPSDYLREYLRQNNLSCARFAVGTGFTIDSVTKVVDGSRPITIEMATGIEQAHPRLKAEGLLVVQVKYRLWLYRQNIHMQRKRRRTDLDEDDIEKEYREGHSQAAIGLKHGVSKDTIRIILRERNVPIRGSGDQRGKNAEI